MRVKQWVAAVVAGAVLVAGGLVALSLGGPSASAQDGIPGVEDPSGAPERARPVRSALDALVAEGVLDEAQADRVYDAVVGAVRDGREERREARQERRQEWAEVLAGEVGISIDELRSQLDAGLTVAEIAAAHGRTADEVVEGLLAAVDTRLDAKVADGTLTQSQADRIAERAAVRIERRIELPLPRPRLEAGNETGAEGS
jgi:hypothetical protein